MNLCPKVSSDVEPAKRDIEPAPLDHLAISAPTRRLTRVRAQNAIDRRTARVSRLNPVPTDLFGPVPDSFPFRTESSSEPPVRQARQTAKTNTAAIRRS